MTERTFNEWGIVDLFGHQRIAGQISEQSIGGCSFIRVDVPACGERPAMTRFFGQGAIYSMTPTTEALARQAANAWHTPPVQRYELPAPSRTGNTEEDDDDAEGDEDDDEGEPPRAGTPTDVGLYPADAPGHLPPPVLTGDEPF
jgi:hypothetical protein